MGLFERDRADPRRRWPPRRLFWLWRHHAAWEHLDWDQRSPLRQGLIAQLPWHWRLAIRVPLYGFAAMFAALFGLFVYYSMMFPNPLALGLRERSPVIRILARDGSLLAERGTAYDYLPLDLVPAHVRNAVIATEDHRFYEHWGVDAYGILRAGFANLRAGRYAQGGSTITQQLAKNVFLSGDRTLERKVEELLLALWLEVRLSKDEILELYLNRVYFGGGAYGIEGAAQRYFEKSARTLTLPEAAVLAGLLKAPSRYSPFANPAAARSRGRVVLQRMREAGKIDVAQHEAAGLVSVRFAESRPHRDSSGIEYAVDFVLERLPPLVGAGHAELIVETTFDSGLQRTAQQVLRDVLERQGQQHGASQGATVVLDNSGAMLALVGGRDHADSQFNRAARSQRQPGSAFKPIVYLAAVEAGMTPDTSVHDVATTIDGWQPRNDDGTHRGRLPLRSALAASVNTVAVRLQVQLGASRVVEVARRLGIVSDLHTRPSLALGTSEVTPLEMAVAYATLANGGASVRPHAIRRVRMGTGRVLYARRPLPARRAVAPDHVAAMNDMLHMAVETGTGRRARLARHIVAGKTGTTQDFRDAWFIGYTGHATAAVWVGNDNGRPMERVAGGTLPAEIWQRVMTAAHAGLEPRPLPGIDRAPRQPVSTRKTPRDPQTAPTADPAQSGRPPRPGATLGSMTVIGEPEEQPPVHLPDRIDEDFVRRAIEGLPSRTPSATEANRLAGFPPRPAILDRPSSHAP